MLYLGYVGFTRAVRLRHRRPGHRPGRRGLAARDPALDAVRLGLPHRRHRARRLVELRGARLGRRTGPGTRSRTPASCRGSPAPPTSTRCWCRSGAACCASGTSRCCAPRSALTILGTFLTRSGVLDSVHAFSESAHRRRACWRSSASSSPCRSALIAWRGDRLRSPGAIDSPVSREGAFLANNVLFAVFAFVVLLGTVFPLIVEALQRPADLGRRAVLRPDDACRSASPCCS